MNSILNQNYKNFHIVFIDDNSDDETFKKTQEFMKSASFPQERIAYVQNLERKFATYNFIHGAFSYCRDGDIQMLLDGDDKFIGNWVFNLFNAFYHENPNVWLAYTTYMTTIYNYGESVDPFRYDIVKDPKGRAHWMGPTRTWQVRLIRQIPLEYHQYQNGTWLDTMYDDGFQYSFLEMSGMERIKYLPEMTYLYTKDYGDNDNASKKKVKHRL